MFAGWQLVGVCKAQCRCPDSTAPGAQARLPDAQAASASSGCLQVDRVHVSLQGAQVEVLPKLQAFGLGPSARAFQVPL